MAAPWSKWVIPLIVIGIIAGVAIAMWFYFFGSASSAAELVPDDTMLYLQVDMTKKEGEDATTLPAFDDLTSMFWKGFANQNPFFSY